MVPGGPSLNPAGRPTRGLSLSERCRRIADPDEIIGFLVATMRNEKIKIESRLVAAGQLLDRGWGKPLASVDLAVTSSPTEGARDWSAVPLEERKSLLERIRSIPELVEGDG